jgi:hypothetical protein
VKHGRQERPRRSGKFWSASNSGAHHRSDSGEHGRSPLLHEAASAVCRDWTTDAAGVGERCEQLAAQLKSLPSRPKVWALEGGTPGP